MRKTFQKNRKMVINHAMKELETEIKFLEDFLLRENLTIDEKQHFLVLKEFLQVTVKNVKKKAGIC